MIYSLNGDRMGTLLKGAVAATAWICVTLIIVAVLWITQLNLDFFGLLIFVLILLAIPFVLTLALFAREM